MSVHLTYSGCAATARTCGADVIHGRAGGAGATQSIDPDRQSPPAWLALNGGGFGTPGIKNLHWQHTTHIQLMPHYTTSILGRAASSAQLARIPMRLQFETPDILTLTASCGLSDRHLSVWLRATAQVWVLPVPVPGGCFPRKRGFLPCPSDVQVPK